MRLTGLDLAIIFIAACAASGGMWLLLWVLGVVEIV